MSKFEQDYTSPCIITAEEYLKIQKNHEEKSYRVLRDQLVNTFNSRLQCGMRLPFELAVNSKIHSLQFLTRFCKELAQSNYKTRIIGIELNKQAIYISENK